MIFRGYHGIGFDGKNANRFLDKLDILACDIADQRKLELFPIIEFLRKFQAMKKATFGVKVNANNKIVVMELKTSFDNLVEYLNNYYENVTLNMLWKVRIAINHITPFLKSTNSDNGLGIYSEQAGESIHNEFKKLWIRYKRQQNHSEYAKMLKSSVVEFAALNK